MRVLKGSLLLMFILAIFVMFYYQLRHFNLPKEYTFSQFLEKARKGEIATANFEKNTIRGELKDGETRYITRSPVVNDYELIKELDGYGVKVATRAPSFGEVWGNIFPYLILVGGMVFLWMLLFRQFQASGSQAMAFGKSRARRYTDLMPRVTFKDVAGVEEAKQELAEVVEFLKNQKKFEAVGAKIPKGVLLLGPPGCGKTLLARAVAGEAGVPFFHISGSEFVEMFVGVGASRVRDLFDQAKSNRPCIIFIDEIDAVGRQRGVGLGGGHDEREQTLNQLLAEMDGFDPNTGIILIAATNRPDILDPALLRPGRFDRRIVVDNPDVVGRQKILEVHVRGKPLAEDVDLEILSRKTPGFSGADLANLVNEAALLAARRGKDKIGMSEFEESIERVIAGPQRKSRVISEKEKEIVAYHELGHAITAKLLPNCDPPTKVTILPRGLALGYTMQLPLEDRYLMTKSELLDRLCFMLGGRVAEELVFNEITTGAQSDLEQATELARRMVCEFGMSENLGPLTLGRKHGPIFLGRDIFEDRNYSEEVASAIDKEVRELIEKSYARTKAILQEQREKLTQLAKVLLEKETLEGEELEALMSAQKQEAEPQKESMEPTTS